MMKLIKDRAQLIAYINKRRAQGAKVIDFGGGGNTWTYEFVDAIADIAPRRLQNSRRFEYYKFDFNDPWAFKKIKRKYDISITSHTLEDLRSPEFLLKNLSATSKEGFILVPSSYTELSYIESFSYLGCCHHRWIFTYNKGKLIIYPKLPSLNIFLGVHTRFKRVFGSTNKLNSILKLFYLLIYFNNIIFKKRFVLNKPQKKDQLIIYWRGNLKYCFINNDFAPSGKTIIGWYKSILVNDRNISG